MTRLCTCADPEQVAARAAAEIAQQLRRAREERGVAHLALSGGTTPGRCYERLGADVEDWDRVEVWFADERCVGPEDEQSNYRLATTTLLASAAIAPERVHRMEGELGPEAGATRYAELLRGRVALAQPPASGHPETPQMPGPPREASAQQREDLSQPALPVLDVIVLGIGPDGHVASLFPGARALDAGEDAVCLGVEDSPKPPPQRVTLSLSMLRAARRCVLLATGAEKAAAVTAALATPTPQTPASLLRRERLSVFVDDAAAPAPPGP